MTSATYFLHVLPADVISHEIVPYLDWESRISLNRLLDPKDKIGVPFKKDVIHSLLLQNEVIKLRKVFVTDAKKPLTVEENYEYVLNILNTLLSIKYVLRFSALFRKESIRKCGNLSNILSEEYWNTSITLEEKAKISELAKKTLDYIERIPYEKEISCPSDTWSPVDAGPVLIVEQYNRRDLTSWDYRYKSRGYYDYS
jgi:hypothetical protein